MLEMGSGHMEICLAALAAWILPRDEVAPRHCFLLCFMISCTVTASLYARVMTLAMITLHWKCGGFFSLFLASSVFPLYKEIVSVRKWGSCLFLILSRQRGSETGDCSLWTTFCRVTNMTNGDPDNIPNSDDQTFPRFSPKRASLMRQIAKWSLRRRHV
jgi:hypothetical protein